MPLGAFSISLAVKDLEASLRFYEKLGFSAFAGDLSQGWQILKNRDTVIGLFQGMFERNMLTFNPGSYQDAQPLEQFTDVRDLQRRLKAQGVVLMSEADESTTGPPSFTLEGVLGYDRRPDSPDEDLVDPHARLAPFWFEEMDELRADGAGNIHLVVWVPWDEAESRVAAGLAAGGRTVRHNVEENFWTLADPAGNEVDVATTSAPDEAEEER